jgi:hypothetical protein
MLIFQITDLDGNVLEDILEDQGGEVVIPYNDSRTAKVTLSVYNRQVLNAQPLDRMLKALYATIQGVYLVFWGVILKPSWRGAPGTVEINAHDQTLWFKKNNHRYGDIVVDVGYPVNGLGMQMLAESAIPLAHQIDRGVRHPGILWGYDDSHDWKYDSALQLVIGSGPMPEKITDPKPNDGAWDQSTRGQQIWETFQQLAGVSGFPDFDLRPIDADHPPTLKDPDSILRIPNPDGYAPGYYAQLDTYAHIGGDKTDDVIFHFGFGYDNLEDMTYDPDGNAVINYAVEAYPGGEQGKKDTVHRALSHNENSWLKYGIYEKWVSANNKDPKPILQKKANAWVSAYCEPPQYFTIQIRPEKGNLPGAEEPYRFIDHFGIGDEITAVAKKGFFIKEIQGRVMRVTLTKEKDKRGTQTSVDCVPDVGGSTDPSDQGI